MRDSINVAYISENTAVKMYENLSSYSDVFKHINEIRKNGLFLLSEFAKANNIELIEDNNLPFYSCDSLEDALICAINYENSLCKSYEALTENLKDDGLKDIFFRLWATSNNEYIPALKSCLKDGFLNKNISEYINENGSFDGQNYENLINKYQKDFSNLARNLQDILSGKADKNSVNEVLKHPKFSFFSGIALGVLGASVLVKNLKDSDEDDE